MNPGARELLPPNFMDGGILLCVATAAGIAAWGLAKWGRRKLGEWREGTRRDHE